MFSYTIGSTCSKYNSDGFNQVYHPEELLLKAGCLSKYLHLINSWFLSSNDGDYVSSCSRAGVSSIAGGLTNM